MSLTLSALFLLAALYGLRTLFHHYLFRHPLDELPSPPLASKLWGHLAQLQGRKSTERFAEIANDYGPVVLLRALLGRRVVLIRDPKALHAVLVKEQDFLQKGLAPSNTFTVLLGPGVLSTRATQHRRQRKLLNPVFSVAHLRNMTNIFYTVSHKAQAAIKARLPKDGTAEIMDMNSWNARATLEMLGQAGLGYSFDNFHAESSDAYGESLKLFFPTLSRLRFHALIVDKLSSVLSDSSIRQLFRLMPLRNFRHIMEITDTMMRRSQDIIDEKKAALQKGGDAIMEQVGEGKDLMSICLKANMAASENERMTDEELLAQMSTFILAGMDTTSNALSRIMNLLAKNPKVQDKLRAEIVEATGNGQTDLDYDALMKLPYLDAVCRETLRVYAPVALTARRATKDLVLPLSSPIRGRDGKMINELIITKGMAVLPHFHASNVDKALWGEDAAEWRPERWLAPLPAALEDAHLPGVYSHLMTFSAGPRSCIGFKFSQLEMKIFLSVIMPSFAFELTDMPIVWNSSAVIYPTMGEQSTKPEMLLKVRALP